MNVIEYLTKHGIKFEVSEHRRAYTAAELAGSEHVLRIQVAKPVIVKADKIFYMCVLPACFMIDLEALKRNLDAKKVVLATEQEMSELFENCQLGAEPPVGNLYGLPTLMDRTLEADKYIVFQAGTHTKAVRMLMSDFKKLTKPYIIDFSDKEDWSETDAMINDPVYYDSFVYKPLYPI